MKNLSVMEQKQIVGGAFFVKVYDYTTHELVKNKRFTNDIEAWNYAESWDASDYHVFIYEDNGRLAYDSEWY